MSLARKCDRCSKFFEGRFNTSIELTTVDNMLHEIEFKYGFSGNLDLCPDCVESFKHWWVNETVIPITKKRGKKDGADRKTT